MGSNRVLITAGENKSALACVRSLAIAGMEVHVSAYAAMTIARWSRFSRKGHTLPSAKENGWTFCRELIQLQQKYGFSAILLVCDYEIGAWLEHGPEIGGHELIDEVIAIPGKEAFQRARDKSLTIRTALSAGVPCPATWFPDDEPIEKIAEEAIYPLIIKPNISEGARGITLVEKPEELESKLRGVEQRWGACHLQEYIPSGGIQYKADVIVDRQGAQHAHFVCRKVRYYPISGGSSTLIVSERNGEVASAMNRLVARLNWFGFADFDFIVDPRDGVAKLIECNPRFPESLSVNIFAGVDVPWLMYCLINRGTVLSQQEWEEGRYSRFLAGDIMWFLSSPDRFRAQPSFFRFLGRELTYYIERVSDPGPWFCYLIEAIGTLLSPRRMAYRFGRGFRRKHKVA
jgi:predicted ATP-grasp superfamily ATP-dependent carboligase